MNKRVILENWRLHQAGPADLGRLRAGMEPDTQGWIDAGAGMQVQEALLEAGLLPAEMRVGHVDACQWVAEEDWVYCARFGRAQQAGCVRLHFGGIDTVADIFMNGVHLAFHDDMYLPLSLDITDVLREDNWLAVYFHSPNRIVRERLAALPEEQRRHMENISVIRKSTQDFGDFGGVTLTTVGLFGDVAVEYACEATIDAVDVNLRYIWNKESLGGII